VTDTRSITSHFNSVDDFNPSQAVQNDKVLDKHWQSKKCRNVDGQNQNTDGGAFNFAMLVQAIHRLTDFNDDFQAQKTRVTSPTTGM